MKKFLTLLLSFLIVVTSFAQDITKNYTVSNFSGIDAGGVFDISLSKQTKHSVSITTNKEILEYITVKIKGSTLSLSLNTDKMPRALRRDLKYIKVSVGLPNVEKILLSGTARLNSSGIFTADKFLISLSGVSKADGLIINSTTTIGRVSGVSKLNIEGDTKSADYEISGASNVIINYGSDNMKLAGSGASKIDYKGSVQYAKISVSGATNVILKGSAERAVIEVSGASSVNAQNFNIDDLDVELSGVSRMTTNVNKNMTAEVSGGSSLKYYGSPIIRKIDINSSASVKSMGPKL